MPVINQFTMSGPGNENPTKNLSDAPKSYHLSIIGDFGAIMASRMLSFTLP